MTSIEKYDDRRALPAVPAVRTVTESDIAIIERQAAIFAKSALAGPLRNKADEIAVVGFTAHAIEVPFTTGLSDLFPIPADGGLRISVSARLRVGLARRAGHEVWFEESTDTAATCCLQRRGSTRVHKLRYTIEQAQKAGLTNKDNWKKHPAPMLRAAASRQLVNIAAQEVMLGIAGGDAITVDYDDDPAIAEVDGAEDATAPDVWDPGPTQEDAPVVQPSPAERAELHAAINDLKPEERARLYEAAKGKIPNIDGPKFQVAHVEQLWQMIADTAIQEAPDEDDGLDRLDEDEGID